MLSGLQNQNPGASASRPGRAKPETHIEVMPLDGAKKNDFMLHSNPEHDKLSSMKRARKREYSQLTLLGNPRASFPKSPQHTNLEAFPNPHPQRDYIVRIDCPDFTSLCPVTGQPDFAEIVVEYTPDKRCIETKSLKLYLASYRNVHSFNEAVINRILDDLVKACCPRWIRIEGRFVARGGLALSVTAEHPNKAAEIAPVKSGGKR